MRLVVNRESEVLIEKLVIYEIENAAKQSVLADLLCKFVVGFFFEYLLL